jgi:hypothetical protein
MLLLVVTNTERNFVFGTLHQRRDLALAAVIGLHEGEAANQTMSTFLLISASTRRRSRSPG